MYYSDTYEYFTFSSINFNLKEVIQFNNLINNNLQINDNPIINLDNCFNLL